MSRLRREHHLPLPSEHLRVQTSEHLRDLQRVGAHAHLLHSGVAVVKTGPGSENDRSAASGTEASRPEARRGHDVRRRRPGRVGAVRGRLGLPTTVHQLPRAVQLAGALVGVFR